MPETTNTKTILIIIFALLALAGWIAFLMSGQLDPNELPGGGDSSDSSDQERLATLQQKYRELQLEQEGQLAELVALRTVNENLRSAQGSGAEMQAEVQVSDEVEQSPNKVEPLPVAVEQMPDEVEKTLTSSPVTEDEPVVGQTQQGDLVKTLQRQLENNRQNIAYLNNQLNLHNAIHESDATVIAGLRKKVEMQNAQILSSIEGGESVPAEAQSTAEGLGVSDSSSEAQNSAEVSTVSDTSEESMASYIRGLKKTIREQFETIKLLHVELASAEKRSNSMEAMAQAVGEETERYAEIVQQLQTRISQTIADSDDKISALRVEFSSILYSTDVLFESASTQLSDEGKLVLNQFVSTLEPKYLRDRIVSIEGHTDDVPIAAELAQYYPTNWELSVARAASATRYLISQGLAADKIRASGRGQLQPIASNDTVAGRAANRRIEIHLEPELKRVVN